MSEISPRAIALRRVFDEAFAAPPRAAEEVQVDLIALRLDGDPYAVPIVDIGGLHKDKRVQRLPTHVADLLGLAGFRGLAVPVFDLAGLLGYPSRREARWLLLAGGVAFAFEAFDGHARIASSAIAAASTNGGASQREHLKGVVHALGASRAVLNVPSLLQAAARRAGVAREGSPT